MLWQRKKKKVQQFQDEVNIETQHWTESASLWWLYSQDDGWNTNDVDRNVDRVGVVRPIESKLLLEIERISSGRHWELAERGWRW